MPKRKYSGKQKGRASKRARSGPRRVVRSMKQTVSAPLWKKIAGGVSGTALGAIAGNVPGAVMGGNMGWEAAKWAGKSKLKSTRTTMSGSHNDLTTAQLGIFKVPRRFHKAKYRTRGTYTDNFQMVLNNPVPKAGYVSAAQGRQVIDYANVICPGGWLKGTNDFAVATNRFSRTLLAESLYDFDEAIAANPAPTGIGVGNPFDNEVAKTVGLDRNRFFLKGVSCKWGFVSMSTVPQLLDFYLICPKNYDHFRNPVDELNQYMLNRAEGQVASGTANALSGATAMQAGAAAADNWGFNPFSLPEFRKEYRVIKHIKMTLNPGDQRHFQLYLKYEQMIDKEWFTQDTGRNRDYLRNLTVIPMLVAKAGLVGVQNSTISTESTEVAYGQAKVGLTSTYQIFTGAMQPKKIRPLNRIFKGMLEADTTDTFKEINDQDAVAVVAKD